MDYADLFGWRADDLGAARLRLREDLRRLVRADSLLGQGTPVTWRGRSASSAHGARAALAGRLDRPIVELARFAEALASAEPEVAALRREQDAIEAEAARANLSITASGEVQVPEPYLPNAADQVRGVGPEHVRRRIADLLSRAERIDAALQAATPGDFPDGALPGVRGACPPTTGPSAAPDPWGPGSGSDAGAAGAVGAVGAVGGPGASEVREAEGAASADPIRTASAAVSGAWEGEGADPGDPWHHAEAVLNPWAAPAEEPIGRCPGHAFVPDESG